MGFNLVFKGLISQNTTVLAQMVHGVSTVLIFMDPCIVNDSVETPTRCNFVIEFIIPKFIEGSTCFERHTAHHQEPQTVFAASGLYTAIR
jgi:hypothetical protein